ncbi:glycosyltransferase family 39 protein [filamentous cyanobacterium LEGE 11480]|uniref:Glycosyltransferase family 39 protein n=1 Tax=Romeriopsis navalis LEGE 11480 TaxID=2777977 RepID=A0A928VMM7_9CYAN|nr:glycosyltransferase family 39 protein [Romeriopsis navalis]MBE9031408.1 glycosyltransferase family 39 protein [Romeriopsis navalis LEGE 11480]
MPSFQSLPTERFNLRHLTGFPYLTLLLWVIPLVIMQSSGQSLMAHDEGIYAIQAKSIIETGDWITPQWGEQINFDRTMGIQWLIALGYMLFGISENVARLPSNLAFIGTVLLLYRIGVLITRHRWIAWLSAAILAIMPIAVQYARLGTQDSVLVFIELLAAWAMLESEARASRSLLMLTGAAFGWGYMIKGFMVIPVAIAFLPYLILQFRQHRHLLNPWLYLGLIVGWIPVVGWLWSATIKYGMMPLQQLVFKLFYLQETTNYDAGPLYYLWNIPANGFPWVFFAIGGIFLSLRNIHCHNLIRRHWALALGFPLTLFAELTLFKTRTHYYPLQLLPWLSLFAAICLHRLLYLYRHQRAKVLLSTISLGFGGIGTLLISAALLGFTNRLPALPGIEQKEILRICGIGLTLGLGWFALLITWLQHKRQWIFRSAKQWLICLLLPAWLTLGLLGLTGLWGDYVPDFKAMLRDPAVATVINHQTVDFIVDHKILYRGGRKRYLILSFYTPQNGRHYREWQPVDIAWVDPNLVALKPDGYETLAEYYGWELLKKASTLKSAIPQPVATP